MRVTHAVKAEDASGHMCVCVCVFCHSVSIHLSSGKEL